MNVFRLGDGSTLCQACLLKELEASEYPNLIFCGKEVDTDGLPIYGWISGECTDCGDNAEN